MAGRRITEQDVREVAALAHISLKQTSSVQLEKLRTDLDEILEHVQTLETLDTTNVVPMRHGAETVPGFREDVSERSDHLERTLSSAPERAGNQVRVPKVIES